MKDLGKIVLHIPARAGSKRVPKKNMRLMNGKPMISYAIETAVSADITKNMYVNTDSKEIAHYVANNFSCFKVYERCEDLATDKASSDEFNCDIIENLEADTLIMINPVCPLVSIDDMRNSFEAYKNSSCDTLITSSSTRMQTFCDGNPVNIKLDEKLAASQDNKKITVLNWAITIWDGKKFVNRMKKQGYASLGDDRLLFDIDPLNGIKVSEEKDFLFIEKILKSL